MSFASTGEKREERFIEGFGVGAFAYVMAERATKKHKKLRRALGLLAKRSSRSTSHIARRSRWTAEISSGDYILVSVLNLGSLGPALRLAPHAQFDDGELDLVLIRPEHRASLIAHLRRAALEGDIALPNFEITVSRTCKSGNRGGGPTWTIARASSKEMWRCG